MHVLFGSQYCVLLKKVYHLRSPAPFYHKRLRPSLLLEEFVRSHLEVGTYSDILLPDPRSQSEGIFSSSGEILLGRRSA